MGDTKENCSVIPHTQPGGGSNDYKLWRHKGNEQIDGPSPAFGQTGYEALVSGATSQSAFDTAASTVLGSWYTSLGASWKQGYYELFTRL